MATAWPEQEDLRRVGMVLGGLALAWYGLRRRGVLGAGFTAVGGVLAGAGITRPLAETTEPVTEGKE
jgi:uncharacterized membrane protein